MLHAVSFADNVPQSDSLRQCRIAQSCHSLLALFLLCFDFAVGSWSRKAGSLWEVTGGTNHCSIFCSVRRQLCKNCKATSGIKIPSIRINIWHSWWIVVSRNLRGTYKQRCGRMLNLKLCLFVKIKSLLLGSSSNQQKSLSNHHGSTSYLQQRIFHLWW